MLCRPAAWSGSRLALEADERVRLEVQDNGCGLPPELGTRIFVPFITTKETGLGLGLSICKRIVEAHGGSIRGGRSSGWRCGLHDPPAAERGNKIYEPATVGGSARSQSVSGSLTVAAR